MSELIKTDFEAIYSATSGGAAVFKDNTNEEIGANDMRSFGKDISDSLLFTYFINRIAANTSGATITLDFITGRIKVFVPTVGLSANNKTIAFDNYASAMFFDFPFTIDSGFYLQFPSNVFMNSFDGNWNTSTKRWTCPETGRYRMHGTYDGTDWDIDIYGPRN